MIFVDINVLLDVANGDPAWLSWSARQMLNLAKIDILVINPIIYAEFSITYRTMTEVEEAVEKMSLIIEAISPEAAFLAGKAFVQYRRNRGARTSLLPDLVIGAHAASSNASILTHDPRRYATYFPTVRLITP